MSDSGDSERLARQAEMRPSASDDIPQGLREEIVDRIVLQEQYAGPLAHPRIVAGYEQMLPGSADRILTMAEEQQRHRLEQEKQGQAAAIARDQRGMNRGFALALALLLVSALAIYMGSDLVGFAMVATSVVSLAGVFVYSQRATQQERLERRAALRQQAIPPEMSQDSDDQN